MKVLFCPAHYILDEYKYGSEFSSSYNIANRISQKYTESVVMTGSSNILTEKKYRIVQVDKNINDFIKSSVQALFFNLKISLGIWKILKKEKFDILHHVRPFLFGRTFSLALVFNLTKKTPFIIGSFTTAYNDSGEGEQKKIIDKIMETFFLALVKKMSIITVRKASRVIVYDSLAKAEIAKYVPEEKIIIIPPGKDKNVFKFKDSNTIVDTVELLYVGNLIPRKGCEFLIRGMAEILKTQPNVILRLVGDGIERENLEKLAKELKVSDKVIFQGRIENRLIQDCYLKANMFVAMQRESTYDQVYIEAMASGLPIVTSDNKASNIMVKDNGFGYVVPQGGYMDFADKVVSILNDNTALESMSKKARLYFEKNYDWDTVIIPKYLKVYEDVLYERKNYK
jgi:glycosyltransferase involved in cell wall biosynthesis